AIGGDSPAGQYLAARGVQRGDFNSYGSRRGNHEVMVRGTFANIRLRNQLADRTGGYTLNHLTGQVEPIYDAAVSYAAAQVPLVVLAGRDYGSGSSRDWAAKGAKLLGVRAVIAQSFERIHRSNLVGMGVAPLEFQPGVSAQTLGLDGSEVFEIEGLAAVSAGQPPRTVRVTARRGGGETISFDAILRIDTPGEADYYRHGGILNYVLHQLAQAG
ncbi:MAG: aconitate hydratase, partial [Bifidobacteriaceae bacterium]|nr:aconitate hydratase [Bifidobacteriaceae bacterium]